MIELIFKILFCHFLGDYVLQTDFLAKTKHENTWHLIAHCFLYTVPFYFVLGWSPIIVFMPIHHYLTDLMKCRKTISYPSDQISHLLFALPYYLITYFFPV